MQFITNLLTKIDELVWGLPLICWELEFISHAS